MQSYQTQPKMQQIQQPKNLSIKKPYYFNLQESTEFQHKKVLGHSKRTNSGSGSGSGSNVSDTFSSINESPKSYYKLSKCIGFGGYGRVYEGMRVNDGLPVVIKLLPKSGIVNWSTNTFSTASYSSSMSSNSSTSMYIPFEIECLIRLRDTPGVVKMIDYFEQASNYVIIMEKSERNITLFDMANGKPFSFNQNALKKIFSQLIRINLALFSKGIVHRDIKPENILINVDDFSLKLIDFGSASNLRMKGEPFREFQGTLECMPPEWILHGFYDSEAATVWSIGVTFFFCLFGRYPYRTKAQIVSGKIPYLTTVIPTELLQFQELCFQMNPNRRITLNSLVSLSWLKK